MERSRPDISFHDGSLSSNSPKEPQHGDHEALYQALSDQIREQAREILELREQVASADFSRGSNALNKSSKNNSMSCLSPSITKDHFARDGNLSFKEHNVSILFCFECVLTFGLVLIGRVEANDNHLERVQASQQKTRELVE